MFRSIADDIKAQFQSGTMITRLIILNLGIWVFMALLKSFTPGDSNFYQTLVEYLSIPGEPMKLLFRPWTIITHMFIHDGFWHVAMNMLYLYWFGRIVGDMIGDKHMLPIYFSGGLAGALTYAVSYQFLPGIGSYALGASAAVSALVLASGIIAPDYELRLLFLGRVRLKFIVFAILIFYLLGVAGTNRGGHIAHLAGMAMGWFFVSQIGKKNDITSRFTSFYKNLARLFGGPQQPQKVRRKSPLTVKYKADRKQNKKDVNYSPTNQEQVDQILDKIKATGYDSLSKEEKEILFQASKK